MRHRQRQPDKEILEHDRKRDIEVKVFELRDRLEDEEYDILPQSQSCYVTITNIEFTELTKKKSKPKLRP